MNIQQSYREVSIYGASPLDLVLRLYDQWVEDLRQVAAAIEQEDIETRTQRINHAMLVIGHLQSSLNFEEGGKVARDLDRFYNTMRQNLLQVQFSPAVVAVRQLITDVLAVRQAWMEVKRVEEGEPSLAVSSAQAASAPRLELDAPHLSWKG